MINVLSEKNSVANRFLLELRDVGIQKDRMRFRKNLERLGEIMAYEISRTLAFEEKEIKTPMGLARVQDFVMEPVLITILRAGLPFMQGFQNFFDCAECGFIGAFRQEGGDSVKVNVDYAATPEVSGRDVIFIDPMLATGSSLTYAIKHSLRGGEPRKIHIAAVIASPEGFRNLKGFLERECSFPWDIWTCALDEKLNDQFYIVPGLGDAGDLSYGNKTEK